MSDISPTLDEILAKNKDALTLSVQMDTSKMENLLMDMYKEIFNLRNEVNFLRTEIGRKANKSDLDSYKYETDKKLVQLGELSNQNTKHIDEIAGSVNMSLSQPKVTAEDILKQLKETAHPPPPPQVTYINQVVAQPQQTQQPAQQRYIPTSTFESVRVEPTPLVNPPVNEVPQPQQAPVQQQPQQTAPQESTQIVEQREFTPNNQNEEPMRPNQAPRLPYQLPDRPSLRVSTPEDYQRMTPEEASDFLVKASETLTPAETGRLAVELSEHVKDPNVENIFVNLAQRLTPRTNKRIVEEVCTYVDTQLSSRILSALSGQMGEQQLTELITDISKRIAEEETSRIVKNLSDKFDQEDTVSMVIRLCSKMNPQQMSAVVAMLALNMTPEESARIAETIATKVQPEKQVEFAVELKNRENEKQKDLSEGKVTERQIESVVSARQAAERISRQSTPNSGTRASTASSAARPQTSESTSNQQENVTEPKVTFGSLNFEQTPNKDLAQRIDYLEHVVQDLNGIVLDMHTELNRKPSNERKEHLVELFDDLARVSAKNSRQESRLTQPAPSEEQPPQEENQPDEIKEILKPETPKPLPRPEITIPSGSNINTDELLEQFLDVAHNEIENAKHSMTEETNKNLKSTESILRQLITKVSTAQEVTSKKLNTQLSETATSLSNELQKGSAESKALYDKLNVVIAQFNERLEGIDKRLTDVSAAAKMPPPIQKLKVSQDGLVDMQPVIDQINAQNALLADLNSRLVQMEKKEVVHPQAFDQLTEKVQQEEEKIEAVTQVADSAEKMASNTNTQLTDYITYQSSEEGQRPFAEINERFTSLEAEIKRLQDLNTKMNKDLTGSRAAINTLRSHSEETTAAMEEIKKLADNIREENSNVEKHMKKVVEYTQNEIGAINEKIKDITRSIERTDDRVDDLTTKIADINQNMQELSHQTPITAQPSDFLITQQKAVTTVDEPTSPITKERNPIQSTKSFASLDSKSSAENSSVFPTKSEKALESTLTAQNLAELQSYNEQMQQTQLQLQQQAALLQKTQQQLQAVQREKIGGVVAKETVISSVDQKKFNEIQKALNQLQSNINIMRKDCDKIEKKCQTLQEEKADKAEFKNMFEQFRIAMAELNNRVKSTKKAVSGKVGREEFDEQLKSALAKTEQDIQTNIMQSTEIGKTSADVRCLMCGQIKKVEPGQTAEQLQKLNVKPSGDRCLVYGDDGEQYFGRNSNGKAMVTKHQVLAPIAKPK
ncbi:hypothetical protein TVAG_013480 [Trichomonas vaginalis G3]|uniref:Uncharacterized protein n=1 Tax=Trichomonas vaginalis (strain ATCC PRA-98 / G3) TaxID=412133 RepID=A2DDA4_TRIV3|nr:A-type inclusion protein-related family [Trichomonas vaginalis G3]EAY21583.1 hypothetical protein TVAG_013480 [Trichomonas vaginalis G3]KAI5489741.1 A-type inclusion protein-related family [Trichomonas vaginalis G3]|eukprot:XP_001582569.1 hypothetical protein [Trichomonas vaginalis G3]